MTRDNVDNLLWANSFDVKTCNSTRLNFFVCQHTDLLLRVVKETHGTVRTSDRDEVFDSSYRVGHSLGYLNIAVETICNFLKDFHVHKFAMGLISLQVCLLLVDVLL